MINYIAVIGTGTMGRGIAACSALNGFKTALYDINPISVSDAINYIKQSIDKLLQKGKISELNKIEAEKNLLSVNNLEDLAECDLIIEAAIENIEIKKEIFAKLDIITSKKTILATNTSSFSITSISSSLTNDKSRVIGMHFFNPANIMKLVEVIKGEFTSANTVNEIIEICKKLGKTPVVCNDTPAFIVNRIARPFYGEALKIMSEDNLTAEQIDSIMKLEGGFSMGPFELMDLIGIDVNLSVTKSVYEAFFYDPKYKPSIIQQKMVDSGLLGRKTGQGFYKY
jgi:3-hydroxybutyryl-CoA dehydrogenase